MTRNVTALVVIGVILLSGAFYAFKSYERVNNPKSRSIDPNQEIVQPPPEPTIEATSSAAEASSSAKTQTLITVTDKGYTPQIVNIKVGDTVVWVNKDIVFRNVSSALHPTHLVYPPLNLGDFDIDQKVTFTFTKPGTYKYHDHLFPSLTGSVIVK